MPLAFVYDFDQSAAAVWAYLGLGVAAAAFLLFWLHHRWITPVQRLELILREIMAGRTPRSFIIEGAPIFTRLADCLERLSHSQRRLTAQISEEEFSLQAILRSMVEGVILVDRHHVIREVNAAFVTQFSLPAHPVNRTVLETLRVAAIEEIIQETFRTGQPQSREISLTSYTPSQPPRYFDVSAVPIQRETRDTEEVVAVFHDISRLKQLEDVRREFVANVSHELRTPLSIFRGYLETLLDNPQLPAVETTRILEIMRRHSLRLNALVDDLLTLARLESRRITLEPVSIRLEPFIKQLVTDLRSKLDEKNLQLLLDLPPDLPPLEADSFRLEQVIYNLLDNSIKYSNPKTTITIRATTERDFLKIRISDEGIGIPSADIPHIFERFYRVDKARSREAGGTGLGLSIVKHIVQLHGGTVQAESQLARGTTISVNFPVTFQEKIEEDTAALVQLPGTLDWRRFDPVIATPHPR